MQPFFVVLFIGFLRGGSKGRGVLLGKRKDSVWEDWGTLGNLREPPPLGRPPVGLKSQRWLKTHQPGDENSTALLKHTF